MTIKSIIPIVFQLCYLIQATIPQHFYLNVLHINPNSVIISKKPIILFTNLFTNLLITNHYHPIHPDSPFKSHSNFFPLKNVLFISFCSVATATTKTQTLSNSHKLS